MLKTGQPLAGLARFFCAGYKQLPMNILIPELLDRVRRQKPVVHHLTNWVTIYDCAQVTKSLGASPVMAHAAEEVADMTGIASALVLNIGTLTRDFVEAMKAAAAAANRRGIPVVLDVCGAGATPLRDEACRDLLRAVKINIIKGNASEIARIAGLRVQTRGVDSTEVSADLATIATDVATAHEATVVITGAVDVLADARRVQQVRNGHAMMASVVGTGCMAASVIGTFAAVESDLLLAATAGLVCYEVAAELAAPQSQGPIEFKNRMLDRLYSLDAQTVARMAKVEP